ncbi:MAG: ATP-binding cassette domain-containing protein [Candidatus Nanopelagicales bacterium]
MGPSGCGKSTLLRLLLGLEDPGSGIVSYDGRDLSGLDRSSVRRQIGTVMQGSQLMPGSIRENVDLGRGLTTDEVWQALADAAVAEEIRDMPMGLSTVVIEGSGAVSGGQRQRILLARALAGRPRILILDEATSALDNVSQAAVVASLDRLAITRLVVAHRLSTIEQADRVVMLADGRVAAQGTYEQLMDEDGPFRDLVQRQQI